MRIGLTGGIGSGKTTVAKIFSSLGVPIYYSDNRGKYLLDHDIDLKEKVILEFGDSVYPEGKLDRKALGAIVFNNAERLQALNALVHPAIGRDYRAWLESLASDKRFSIKEAAILFETGGHREMDETILVSAPEDMRVARVMARDGVSEEAVRARMDKQWPEGDKLELADYIIVNDGEHSLVEQVMGLYQLWA